MKIYTIVILVILILTNCTCFDNDDTREEIQLNLLSYYPYSYIGYGPEAPPGCIGDSLILMSGNKYITCLYIDSLKVKWKMEVPGGGNSTILEFLYDENNLYGWQERHGIYAWDVKTGENKWTFNIGDEDLIGFYPCISPDHYFVSAFDGTKSWYWSLTKNGDLSYLKS